MAITVGTPYSGAAASPAYSGVFIPEIWSGKLIEKFYSTTVLAAIANTDYEGEISAKGDKVRIRTKPTITIRDYTTDQALTVERPSSANVELTIDHAKYFAAVLDDIMEKQSDIGMMSAWADDASEQMKITIDTHILGLIHASIDADNLGTTAGLISNDIDLGTTAAPAVLTPSTVLNYIVDMGTVLDEQNIPETGRWLVIPAWAAGMIKKSDLRNASISGDGVSMLRNGRLGMIDRFTLYASNLLPTATEGSSTAVRMFAGHSHGMTFASQFTNVETLRAETTFGNILRGLQVYGMKVVDGNAICELYAVKG